MMKGLREAWCQFSSNFREFCTPPRNAEDRSARGNVDIGAQGVGVTHHRIKYREGRHVTGSASSRAFFLYMRSEAWLWLSHTGLLQLRLNWPLSAELGTDIVHAASVLGIGCCKTAAVWPFCLPHRQNLLKPGTEANDEVLPC